MAETDIPEGNTIIAEMSDIQVPPTCLWKTYSLSTTGVPTGGAQPRLPFRAPLPKHRNCKGAKMLFSVWGMDVMHLFHATTYKTKCCLLIYGQDRVLQTTSPGTGYIG